VTALAGPLAVVATLLAVGAVLKVVDPSGAVGALRASGFGVGPTGVRIASAVEAAVAGAALLTAWAPASLLVAVSYAAFAGFVVVALRRELPISSCGCLGQVDTPPSWLHVGVDISAAVVAGAAALSPPGSLWSTLRDQPVAGIPFLLSVATGVLLLVALMADLPKVHAAGTPV
jgi:hypothetical protein